VSTSLPGQTLRDAAAEGTLAVPGAFNALVGRLIQRAGYKATYLSGAAFSAASLAMPDIGLFTLGELSEETRRLTRRIDLPVIVDADTGFGEPINVARTVEELEFAGAAAIQLEDQQLPKRCGHLSGKTLVSTEEMVAKIRAAVASRDDASLVILARTDARDSDGIEAALDRAKRYVEAGADWIFPEALASAEEFERFAREVRVPLVANMTEFGKSPLLPLEELSELGYAAELFPVTLLRLAMHTVGDSLKAIRDQGSQSAMLDHMQTRQQLYDLLGYTNYEASDRAYFTGETDS